MRRRSQAWWRAVPWLTHRPGARPRRNAGAGGRRCRTGAWIPVIPWCDHRTTILRGGEYLSSVTLGWVAAAANHQISRPDITFCSDLRSNGLPGLGLSGRGGGPQHAGAHAWGGRGRTASGAAASPGAPQCSQTAPAAARPRPAGASLTHEASRCDSPAPYGDSPAAPKLPSTALAADLVRSVPRASSSPRWPAAIGRPESTQPAGCVRTRMGRQDLSDAAHSLSVTTAYATSDAHTLARVSEPSNRIHFGSTLDAATADELAESEFGIFFTNSNPSTPCRRRRSGGAGRSSVFPSAQGSPPRQPPVLSTIEAKCISTP
jgi:hypothetical protein